MHPAVAVPENKEIGVCLLSYRSLSRNISITKIKKLCSINGVYPIICPIIDITQDGNNLWILENLPNIQEMTKYKLLIKL